MYWNKLDPVQCVEKFKRGHVLKAPHLQTLFFSLDPRCICSLTNRWARLLLIGIRTNLEATVSVFDWVHVITRNFL